MIAGAGLHCDGGCAAAPIIKGMEAAIAAKTVTCDLHRLMEGATKLKCSEFGNAVIKHMW